MRVSSAKKGFTLIELLIVIAVLGILAAVVLVAIDPVQQLARGRDAGRKSASGQLGRAMQAYFTVNSRYPTNPEWDGVAPADNVLVATGEIKTFPINPVYSAGGADCTINPYDANGTGVGNEGGIVCYDVDATPDAVIFVQMESNSEIRKCAPATPLAWFVWSSADGRAGLVCTAVGSQPGPGPQTFL